jgi:hypothetical protein
MSRRQYMIHDPEKIDEILEERRKKKEEPKSPGRPGKKLEDLPERWQNTILDSMREGASVLEVRAKLGLSRPVWERLEEQEPEFGKVVEEGKELCEAWWMSEARKNLYNGKFQTVLWYMNMKNRFGWKDKAEVDYTSGGKAIMPQIMVFGLTDPLNKKLQQVQLKAKDVTDATEVPLQLDSGTTPA